MSVKHLKLFSVCHLNLAYSSIEEAQRPEVVERCYWPLLRLARELGVRFGIEASAYTLDCIHQIDPTWIQEFQSLTEQGICELIGSGYVQLIGPLVPPEVNAANLRLGHDSYERIVGFRPDVALVNEQAYSCGLVQHYLNAGYRAIVMEWDNPVRWHPEWRPQWRYLPQIACGQHGEEIPVIWNKSIAFQKFQRLAHGEMDFREYLEYLEGHLSDTVRAFPFYGNDVEVFDFRPGRFHTEPKLEEQSEWIRIQELLQMISKDQRFEFILPTKVLELMELPEAGNRLHLESPEDPVPVKKQEKYNITRWAVTGRDDSGVNTACHRIYQGLKARGSTDDALWRELCYLWSSDFRTHITEKRWRAFCQRVNSFEEQLGIVSSPPKKATGSASSADVFRCHREGRFLRVETDQARLVLNCRRGLAIDSLVIRNVSNRSILGTLPHGYYQDISLGADYYSGHLVLEAPGQPKVTDLSPVEPATSFSVDRQSVMVEGSVETPLGPIRKSVCMSAEGAIRIEYDLDWHEMPPGALRLAHMTLNPEAFDPATLFFETHNGGFLPERFQINGRIEHGRSVSFLVSASTALGMTSGHLTVGDSQRAVRLGAKMDQAAVVGQITYLPVSGTFFCRASCSAAELDETCRNRDRTNFPRKLTFTMNATRLSTADAPLEASTVASPVFR